MSYQRVIPRDLFNEANLLKCYGQLYLKLESRFQPHKVAITHYGNVFVIEQDSNDGSLSVYNVQLRIHGRLYQLRRPLNSREPWPLYAQHADYAEYAVFTDDGELTQEFLDLILEK